MADRQMQVKHPRIGWVTFIESVTEGGIERRFAMPGGGSHTERELRERYAAMEWPVRVIPVNPKAPIERETPR